ncbi:MAG: hybrid sensor histidine kinase/response regulator, partial [Cyclobacteriaceae bacterium]|nr:hybrid sensor histidine kinase/response regulator [Cyclobacteriaceae bacterium]
RIKFFTDISHELRTPLTLILAPLEKIVTSNFGSARIKNQLMLMLRNGDRMLQLINQLLDLRKLETGHMQLKAAKGNMANFVKEVSLSFRESAQSRGIEFKVESTQSKINVWFDREKFEIILFNLLSNALKYTPDQGAIHINVDVVDGNHIDLIKNESDSLKTKKTVRITIENTGRGIAEDQIEHIFERFYSGENQRFLRIYSSGVGLEIVKNMVDLHKGEISVKTTFDENGINGQTCFTINLKSGKNHFTKDELLNEYKYSEDIANYGKPITPIKIKEQTEDIEYPISSLNESKEESLLIVEDNPEVRKFVADIFKEQYNIFEAKNGDEGLAIA